MQLDYWSCKLCKAPVKSSPPTNQHPVFLQARCPSCCPTNNVKALKGKYHIPWTCLSQAHVGVFQLSVWPLIVPGYLGEGCHASHQPSDASTPLQQTEKMPKDVSEIVSFDVVKLRFFWKLIIGFQKKLSFTTSKKQFRKHLLCKVDNLAKCKIDCTDSMLIQRFGWVHYLRYVTKCSQITHAQHQTVYRLADRCLSRVRWRRCRRL